MQGCVRIGFLNYKEDEGGLIGFFGDLKTEVFDRTEVVRTR